MDRQRTARRVDSPGALRRALFALLVVASQASIAGAAAGWETYNRSFDSQRYSPLHAIDRHNVQRLRPVCETQVGEMGPLESGLLVVGRRLFLTTARTTLALDAVDCRVLWRHVEAAPAFILNPATRGPAYAAGRIFRGTADGWVLALDAQTGAELWRIRGADPARRELFNAAPIVWRGRVYIGTSGGDWGGQSRMLAYDVRDGHELWRFNLIPADDEPGAESWKLLPGGHRGGGATWTSYTLDTRSGELFLSTGNPAPALAADVRPGDNLYTNSVVVLDAASGRLLWYTQPVPADAFDYDLAAAPMLYRTRDGRPRVAVGGKDGHLYLIDRRDHGIVAKVPVTTVVTAPRPTVEGVRVCPGVYGGVEWNGPAFDPHSGAIYVGAVDLCMLYQLHGEDLQTPAAAFLGTVALPSTEPSDGVSGWVTAVDGTSGRVLWRYRAEAPVIAGVTATAGGLVLTGDSYGHFLALDAADGRELARLDVRGTLAGGVITYSVAGRQYIAYAAGGVVRGRFVRDVVEPKVVIATLAAASAPLRRRVVPALEAASASGADPAARGAALYAKFCTLCHGPNGDGLGGPRLRAVAKRADPRPLREIIVDPKPAMARFYPGALDDGDVADLAAFLDGWQ